MKARHSLSGSSTSRALTPSSSVHSVETTGVVSDTSLMRDATAAANGIIRNQTDCEAVKANLADVRQKLDGIEAQIQTATARTTLDALRRQVRTIAEACGAR